VFALNVLRWVLCLVLLPVFSGVGCEDLFEDEDDDDPQGAVVDVGVCLSGLQWQGGNEESPLMRPGGDCIACHKAEDEGPTFAIAGTVFEALDEADDCFGVGGVTVELTGSDGQVVTLSTNDAGNFFLKANKFTLTMPYTARVLVGDKERIMATPQNDGNCASCHQTVGAEGAPGRIIAP
jgi:hypothetical protein